MKVYDLEHHCYSKEMLEQLYDRTEPPYYHKDGTYAINKYQVLNVESMRCVADPKTKSYVDGFCDLDEWRIDQMDNAGVDVAFLSTCPFVEDFPRDLSIKCARITNDTIAAACKTHPDRYMGTISLPMAYVDDALKEFERARDMGLKYIHTHSSWIEGRLSDEKYIPLLAKCEELGVPIYIHPGHPHDEYFNDMGFMFNAAGFGFSVDVMNTVIKMILTGRFDQFPKLKIILGHMAEYLPYVSERLENRFHCLPFEEVKCKKSFDYYIRNKNILMTTSGITDPDVAMFVIKKYGVDNIMFGSDFPWEPFKPGIDFVKNLPISNEDKEKIFYKNAEKYIL